MYKIGFVLSPSKDWLGGVNYFKSLLFGLDKFAKKDFEIVVFLGKKVDSEFLEMYSKYAEIRQHGIFDRGSFQWYIRQLLIGLFKKDYLLNFFVKRHKIEALSHANMRGDHFVPFTSWIPDFQHRFLPQLFSKRELEYRDMTHSRLAKKSNLVFLSSYTSLSHFNLFYPDFGRKGRVLQFVAKPEESFFSTDLLAFSTLKKKYDLSDDFFFLPNQFWVHKNHQVVLTALKNLKERGIEETVVFTGNTQDYRNKDYIDSLTEYIDVNGLKENARVLGMVPYNEIFILMKHAKAVINPSLFEGWSTTVEECKSVNKNLILSDIPVHKEQAENALFFQKDDPEELARILETYSEKQKVFNKGDTELYMTERTKEFIEKYRESMLEILEKAYA